MSSPAPKVLICDKLDPRGVEVLEKAGIDVEVRTGLTGNALAEAVRDVQGILVRSATRIDEAAIESAVRLKVVGRAGIGVDNIDVAAATRRGVLVMNTPLANATTTAELALAHLFSLARHLPAADRSMKEGRWDKSSLVGTEITGKTLGVLGLGKIGKIVAEKALGLGMKVVAHDAYLVGQSPLSGVELVPFEELLAQSDFVTVHVPKSPETEGLIDRDVLKQMKPTACLIHCARGGIVVERDLCEALQEGILGGAALDVFETEPLPADSPLRSVPNLHLSPHLGASSGEAQARVAIEIAQQMADFLVHGEARFAVNAPALSAEMLRALRPYLELARRAGSFLTQSVDEPWRRVEISYAGELATLPTEPMKIAVLAGLLGPTLEGPVNDVNASLIAKERGMKVLEECEEKHREFPSLLKIKAFSGDDRFFRVYGTVFRGQPRLVRFSGFGVDLVLDGQILMTHHKDAPGVLGQVATWMGERGINIEGLHMGEADDDHATALALFQINRPLVREEIQSLAELPPIVSARSISVE